MGRTVAIKRLAVFFLVVGIFVLMDIKNIYTYDVQDVGVRNNFKTHVFRLTDPQSYSIHIEGELDGGSELYLVGPEFDINKDFQCLGNEYSKLDSGKVDEYLVGDYYENFSKPNLCYVPCTAKKGHLSIKISFGRDLRKSLFGEDKKGSWEKRQNRKKAPATR